MTLPTAEQLLNLADRTPHGLTPGETARLRQGVAHHCARAEQAEREVDTLTAVCRSNKQAYIGAVKDAMAADERTKQAEAERDQLRADLDRQAQEMATWRATVAALDAGVPGTPRHRAEQAEAELTALKTITSGYCGHCGRGDCSPTADQWYEQRQRADRAEAAIERVRATCARLHDLAHAAHGVPTSSYDRGIDRAAKVILAALDEPQEQQSGTRPTHPDGTPYRYAEIAAEGWEHCDGCGQWGNTWTPEQPHRCPAPIKVATAPAP